MNNFNNKKDQKSGDDQPRKNRFDNPIVNMIVHVFTGTIFFLTVATAAYGVEQYVHFLKAHEASDFLVFILQVFETVLVVINVLLSIWHIIKSIIDEFVDE
jgi:phosphotransferase system  glucose/maltose/N-acetylglucosamine-specific IIC component